MDRDGGDALHLGARRDHDHAHVALLLGGRRGSARDAHGVRVVGSTTTSWFKEHSTVVGEYLTVITQTLTGWSE